jgi:CRISPR-associated protein Csd2
MNAFAHDHAAARGEMNARALIVFKHESKLGNARSSQLFDLVKIEKKDNVVFPRSFEDYKITIDKNNLPDGVSVEEMI